MRSVDTIPRDDATREKIKDIIDRQFDLEIYLKNREAYTIQREIAKAEQIIRDLEFAVNNEAVAASLPESAHYTRRSAAAAALATNALYNAQYEKRSTQRGHGLFGRRSDGVYVRLSCPSCKRDDFANQQGFLNHCRLAHNLEFGPYEQIMQRCGTPVDESEVPPDHPARLRPVTKPVPIVRKKKERPTIKVFEEDVDLESDRSDRAVRRAAAEATRKEAAKSVPETKTSAEEEKRSEKGSSSTQQQLESFAAAVASPSVDDAGSRFYIKREIIVGNVSKFILPEKRDPTLKQFTHKWMVYVVEPPQAQEVSKFITAVRFYLHPSYKPHDIVDVTEPPFRLTRLGWGEFPIRIQLFFVDRRRNKSVDIIHQVKLDYTHSGRQVLGGERRVEIELDRNTDFEDTSISPKINTTPAPDSARPVTQSAAPSSTVALNAAKQKLSLLQGILKECVRPLPIVQSSSQSASSLLPYTCATSAKAFWNWPVGRRKALEWHRAHLLRIKVQQQAFETMDDILRSAASALTTKDVVVWCREHGYTPQRSDAVEEAEPMKLGHCKFCGCSRDSSHGLDDNNCRYKPEAWSSKKRALSSVTSVSKLLSQLPPGWNDVCENDNMDIDVDTAGEGSTDAAQTRPRELVKRIQETMEQRLSTVEDERQMDWIWSVVKQLRLKGVIANDMVLGRDGSLKGPTPDFDLVAAMNQRLVAGSLLMQAVRAFLRRLLNASIDVYSEQLQSRDQGTDKMLTPVHVYQAARRVQEFDFLTNAYMGPANDEQH